MKPPVDIGKDSTIRELIAELAKRYGKKFDEQIIPGELVEHYTVLLNGKTLPAHKCLSTLLKENDSIVLMPEVIP